MRIKAPSVDDTIVDTDVVEIFPDRQVVDIVVVPFDRYRNYLGPG